MATKTVTYCDVTRKECSQAFLVGLSNQQDNYRMDLSQEGLKLFLESLINNVSEETIDLILQELVGKSWRETLIQK
jgi:hypothetical protein